MFSGAGKVKDASSLSLFVGEQRFEQFLLQEMPPALALTVCNSSILPSLRKFSSASVGKTVTTQ